MLSSVARQGRAANYQAQIVEAASIAERSTQRAEIIDMAFAPESDMFHAGRRPVCRPDVRRLARTTSVRTSVTLTLNKASIAALICGLVAAVSTRNAYSLRAPYAADDFSVTTGATLSSRHVTEGVKRVLAIHDLFLR